MMTTRRRSPSTASKEDHDLKRPRLVEGGGQSLPIEILSPARSTAAWALTSLVGGLSHGNRAHVGLEVDDDSETPPGAPPSSWGSSGGRRSASRKPSSAQETTTTAAPYSVESSTVLRIPLYRGSARDVSAEKRRGSSVGSSVGDYSRREKSLGLLCVNFMHLYSGAGGSTSAVPNSAVAAGAGGSSGGGVGDGGGEISDLSSQASSQTGPNHSNSNAAANRLILSLDKAADELKVERRRIYDIVNILEALDFVTRQRKNTYTWNGGSGLRATLRRLQAEAIQLWPDDATANGLVDPSINNSSSGSSGGIGGVNSGGGSRSGRKGRPPSRAVPPPTSSVSDQPASANGIVSGAGGYAGGSSSSNKGSSSTAGGGDRKGKSLGFVCARFVQLFLVGHSMVGLGDARERIFGETSSTSSSVGKGDEATEARENKTKVRRLYDIANVLAALGLIVKDPCSVNAERRPCFRWVSASPRTILASHGCDPTKDAAESAALFAMVPPPTDTFDSEPTSSGSTGSLKSTSSSGGTSAGSINSNRRAGNASGRHSLDTASSSSSHNSLEPPLAEPSSSICSLSTPPRSRAGAQQLIASSTAANPAAGTTTATRAARSSSFMSTVSTTTGCDAETEAAVSTMSILCQASPMADPSTRDGATTGAADGSSSSSSSISRGQQQQRLQIGSGRHSGVASSWAAWFDPWAGSLPLDPDAMLSHQVERLRTFMDQYQDHWDVHYSSSSSSHYAAAFNDDLNAAATATNPNGTDNMSGDSHKNINLDGSGGSSSCSSGSGTSGNREWVEGEAVAAAAALALSPGAARRQEAAAKKKERDAQREAEGAMRGLAAVSAALSSCEAEEAAAAAASGAAESAASSASSSSTCASSSLSSSSAMVPGFTGRRCANAPLAGAFSPSPVIAHHPRDPKSAGNNGNDSGNGNDCSDGANASSGALVSTLSPMSAGAAVVSPQSGMGGAAVAAMMLAEALSPKASTAEVVSNRKISESGNMAGDL